MSVSLSGQPYVQTWFGLSTDTKPVQGTGLSNQPMLGDNFVETDTGRTWIYSGPSPYAGWILNPLIGSQSGASPAGASSTPTSRVKAALIGSLASFPGGLSYLSTPPKVALGAIQVDPNNMTPANAGISMAWNGGHDGSCTIANFVYHCLPGAAGSPTLGDARVAYDLDKVATLVGYPTNWTNAGTINMNSGLVLPTWYAQNPAMISTFGNIYTDGDFVLAFETDEPVIGFCATYVNGMQLFVNGQIAWQGGILSQVQSSAGACMMVNFGSRQSRQIVAVFPTGLAFGALITSNQGTPTPLRYTPFKLAVEMDSIAQQGQSSYDGLRIPGSLAIQLGTWNYVESVQGGTGFAEYNSTVPLAQSGAFEGAPRLTQITANSPDLVVTITKNGAYPTGNATTLPPAGDTNAAIAYHMAQLRSALPNTILAYGSFWRPASTQGDATTMPIAEAVRQNILTLSAPWLYFDPIRGYWLNSSGVMGADGGQTTTTNGATAVNAGTINVAACDGFPTTGTLIYYSGTGDGITYSEITYTGVTLTAGQITAFTGCSGTPAMASGSTLWSIAPWQTLNGTIKANVAGSNGNFYVQPDGANYGVHPTFSRTMQTPSFQIAAGATVLPCTGNSISPTSTGSTSPTAWVNGQSFNYTGISAAQGATNEAATVGQVSITLSSAVNTLAFPSGGGTMQVGGQWITYTACAITGTGPYTYTFTGIPASGTGSFTYALATGATVSLYEFTGIPASGAGSLAAAVPAYSQVNLVTESISSAYTATVFSSGTDYLKGRMAKAISSAALAL